MGRTRNLLTPKGARRLTPLAAVGLLAGIGSIVLPASGPAQAAPVATLEALVSGFATQSTGVTLNDGESEVNLPANYAQTAGNSGYGFAAPAQTSTVGGSAYDFAYDGVASLSLDPDLTVPMYTSRPGSLTMAITETGLVGPGEQFLIQPEFDGIFHTHADTAVYSLYYDPTDTAFGTADLLYSKSETNPHPPAQYTFSDSTSFVMDLTSPFSITEVITFTGPLSSGGTALTPHLDGEVDIKPVPEPSALMLLGPGSMMLGWLLTKRQAAH
ncbi:MAG TPA: hypothetical protein VMB34_24565 [Acetobacteraceae bacterium]|nr:hypothetical protein [Acetobacteraceae bacterium]